MKICWKDLCVYVPLTVIIVLGMKALHAATRG